MASFTDVIGEGTTVELPDLGGFATFEQFRRKATNFLREHEDTPAGALFAEELRKASA